MVHEEITAKDVREAHGAMGSNFEGSTDAAGAHFTTAVVAGLDEAGEFRSAAGVWFYRCTAVLRPVLAAS